MPPDGAVGGSFRDPSGVVFRRDGEIYRQVNEMGIAALEHLERCGLYDELVSTGRLISHRNARVAPLDSTSARRVIRPTQIPFISYPYEWCFSQLKDAALATLSIQSTALRHGMVLKDASAFNIQFVAGRPTLIDTLSFAVYEEGRPWVAYRQFCEHLLAPLLLIRYGDPLLGRLPLLTADGVPLETVSRLLPLRTFFRPSSLLHIHLHARSMRRFGRRRLPKRLESRGMSRKALHNLVDGLRQAVDTIDWEPTGTEWADYAEQHGYAEESMEAKRALVRRAIQDANPGVVWDLGANTGEFSRIAAAEGADVVSIDSDSAAVERNYRRVREAHETAIHPLWIDLRSPSPDLGWAEAERDGLAQRCNADMTLALALVHHLAISANVPIPRILNWLARLSPQLLIEFVPKEDPQVQRLLVSREDIFDTYTLSVFERELRSRYNVLSVEQIPGSERILFHAARKGGSQ